MGRITESFGRMVFNDAVMKDRLPKDVYRALRATITQGAALDLSLIHI